MRDGAVLIIQHQAIGQPGTILETLIADGSTSTCGSCTGARTACSRSRYRALIVLGGSMNTDQDDAYPFLRRTLLLAAPGARVPLLGICLGAQQLAA